jgi:hypothetical protein
VSTWLCSSTSVSAPAFGKFMLLRSLARGAREEEEERRRSGVVSFGDRSAVIDLVTRYPPPPSLSRDKVDA